MTRELADALAQDDLVFEAFVHVGATSLEASALEAMVDLYGPVDDFATALEEYREMVSLADRLRSQKRASR